MQLLIPNHRKYYHFDIYTLYDSSISLQSQYVQKDEWAQPTSDLELMNQDLSGQRVELNLEKVIIS